MPPLDNIPVPFLSHSPPSPVYILPHIKIREIPYSQVPIKRVPPGRVRDFGMRSKPEPLSYLINNFNHMQLRNDERKPWPKFIFDRTVKKIIGVQLEDGNIAELNEYEERLCYYWGLDYLEPEKDEEGGEGIVKNPPPYESVPLPPSYEEH